MLKLYNFLLVVALSLQPLLSVGFGGGNEPTA